MKLRKLINIALSLAVAIGGISCKKEAPETPGTTDVQFAIPEKLEVEANAESISFRIQFGKAPSQGDKVLLEDQDQKTYACPVTTVGSTIFNASAAALWSDGASEGLYKVYFQRGSHPKKLMGETRLVIIWPQDEVEVKPAAGSTVYGRVKCEGEGIADVVVSDGVEVAVTDKDGVYQLASKKYHKLVFISVPSGYEPLREGILPQMFQPLTKAASTAERVDFSLRKAEGQDKHTLLLFGDMHLARRTNDRNQFQDFVRDVNDYVGAHPSDHVYGLTLGDMTWDLYWITNNYGYKDYLSDAKAITGLTIYHTIGNHDHSMYYSGDYDTVKEYKETLGPTYYSFNVGKVHYVVLDDVYCINSVAATDENGNACFKRDYDGKIVDEQFNWLRKDLSYVPTSTPIVLTMHIPMLSADGRYYSIAKASENTLVSILKPYVETHVFTAHTHTVYNHDRLSSSHVFEHNAGSVCGTWWWSGNETPGVHIGQDGSPGGYTLLTVDGTSFRWQYKATKKDVGFQFRSYDRNTIHLTAASCIPNASGTYAQDFAPDFWGTASTANEVYINVWNYDPSWKVEVSEGGKALTPTLLTGGCLDPLHLVAYTAKRLNKNKTATFATTPNYHTFRVSASSPSSTLEIKVTDRFGNIYTESMTRPKTFSTDTYKF